MESPFNYYCTYLKKEFMDMGVLSGTTNKAVIRILKMKQYYVTTKLLQTSLKFFDKKLLFPTTC